MLLYKVYWNSVDEYEYVRILVDGSADVLKGLAEQFQDVLECKACYVHFCGYVSNPE